MFDLSDQHHKSNESHDQHVILHSFTSDLESTLREAAGRGELSDWLVSLAPSGGFCFLASFLVCLRWSCDQVIRLFYLGGFFDWIDFINSSL